MRAHGRFLHLVTALAVGLATLTQARPAMAHPHVFVDARIGFVIDGNGLLEAIRVAWRFDPFHTLYILSFDGIAPTPGGGLTAEAQADLAHSYTDWQRGFNGFAKLTLGGGQIALEAPTEVQAGLRDGQLEISFTRDLTQPVALTDGAAEVAVYDATYYHAVSVAAPPDIVGSTNGCNATLSAHQAGTQTALVQEALSQLEREASPVIEDVGALLADRITIACN
ncbi:MAG: DUF1007 family protein [Pseudomonadota bacterium]